MIDLEDETEKFKMFLGALVMFLFSAWYSYAEFKYSVWGEVTTASVTDVKHVPRRYRSSAHTLVKYTFQEKEGATRTRELRASANADISPNDKFEVQYLAGEGGDSRPNGERNWISVIIFFATLLFLGFSTFQMAREANPAYLQKKYAGRRRR